MGKKSKQEEEEKAMLVDGDGFYGFTDLDMKTFFPGGEAVKQSAGLFRMEDYR